MSSATTSSLPAKEQTLFKSIVKHYETKQYKKGLKASDTVLRKFPEHGETLAMKGLLLNCMDKKTEAYELVRKGVKLDIKSQVCWHVYGLLYRSDREYLQAIKCYRGALRHDPENMKILRDLSMLQVQMRDLKGFVETRQQLLALKPTNKVNWFTFAVSQHLNGRHAQAARIVDAYENTLEGAPENDYEHSEMLLYKSMLLEESGDDEEALRHLKACEGQVMDKLGLKEQRGTLLLRLSRFEEAHAAYSELLIRNPENFAYHAGLQAAELQSNSVVERWRSVEISDETERVLRTLYTDLQQRFPRSNVCRRLPLDFAKSPAYFREVFAAYVLPHVRKGVPALFADLKPLCANDAKRVLIGDIIAEWLESLESSGRVTPESPQIEMPNIVMWVRVLAAQHADICGDTAAALKQIDTAIEHTPTLLDLYMFKARIFKHAGDLVAASEWMDEARKMDLADRYLNTKATRYMLRADQLEQAQKTVALFTKDGDQNSNLFDMQCMWYELEVAQCHERAGELGRTLKNFNSIEKHFTDIVEDQFDFHTYCIRKMTLRAYVRLLRLEDHLWGHAYFVRAACGMIETYLRIADKPRSAVAQDAEEELDNLSAAERKKAESKKRKAEAKAKAEADAKAVKDASLAASEKNAKGKKASKDKPVDDDPDGAALADVDSPLEKASAYLRTLQLHAPSELRPQLLAWEVAMRKRKFLLALRALCRARSLAEAGDPAVHRCVVRFLHAAEKEALSPVVAEVLAGQRTALGIDNKQSLLQFNQAYLDGSSSVAARCVAAEMLLLLAPAEKDRALNQLLALDLVSTSLQECVDAHRLITTVFDSASAGETFKQRASERYSHSAYFKA